MPIRCCLRQLQAFFGVATEQPLISTHALLLARCDVLVGKFSSGLFRAAYALASARRGGALPPFISLDAPWCADYGVPAGYNDNFPLRYDENAGAPRMVEQINPDDVGAATGVVRLSTANEFLC